MVGREGVRCNRDGGGSMMAMGLEGLLVAVLTASTMRERTRGR